MTQKYHRKLRSIDNSSSLAPSSSEEECTGAAAFMCTYLCENSIWAALDLLDKKPGGLFQFVALSSHQGDECSFLQRLLAKRQANASRGTCDEDMLS